MTELPLAKQIIKRQLNRSGNILISAVEPMTDEEFFQRQNNSISVAWTVGHLACVMDLFGSWLSEQERQFPAEMHQVFNSLDMWVKGPEKWELVNPQEFSRSEILLLLRRAQLRLLEILEKFNLDLWNTMPPSHIPDNLPNYGAIWELLSVHTYWHLGELCGSSPRFYGTHTINSLVHYFCVPPIFLKTREELVGSNMNDR